MWRKFLTAFALPKIMFRAISSALSFLLMLWVIKIVMPEALELIASLIIKLLRLANNTVDMLDADLDF